MTPHPLVLKTQFSIAFVIFISKAADRLLLGDGWLLAYQTYRPFGGKLEALFYIYIGSAKFFWYSLKYQ